VSAVTVTPDVVTALMAGTDVSIPAVPTVNSEALPPVTLTLAMLSTPSPVFLMGLAV
jgi:hypothetical protein